jgi:hypothetical protein
MDLDYLLKCYIGTDVDIPKSFDERYKRLKNQPWLPECTKFMSLLQEYNKIQNRDKNTMYYENIISSFFYKHLIKFTNEVMDEQTKYILTYNELSEVKRIKESLQPSSLSNIFRNKFVYNLSVLEKTKSLHETINVLEHTVIFLNTLPYFARPAMNYYKKVHPFIKMVDTTSETEFSKSITRGISDWKKGTSYTQNAVIHESDYTINMVKVLHKIINEMSIWLSMYYINGKYLPPWIIYGGNATNVLGDQIMESNIITNKPYDKAIVIDTLLSLVGLSDVHIIYKSIIPKSFTIKYHKHSLIRLKEIDCDNLPMVIYTKKIPSEGFISSLNPTLELIKYFQMLSKAHISDK